MRIWIVDAFTTTPYHGGPAAVVMVDGFPEGALCQKIAAEMNLSVTAFVKPIENNYYHIRWFTPKVEVKLCGHATLASAHVLYQENRVKMHEIFFDSQSSELRVYKQQQRITLDFPLHRTGISLDKNHFQQSLGVEVVGAVQALEDVIVELYSAAAVTALNVDAEKISAIDCRGVIVTAKASGEYDFISRFFAPREGVLEDPVTGSAHCKLADYWGNKLNKSHLRAYQASARGGALDLSIHGDRVHITGDAVTVLKGEWLPSVV
jgi:PhzF family phenazine biosynthesis protein